MTFRTIADLRLARRLIRLLPRPTGPGQRLAMLAMPPLLALRGLLEAFSLGALILFVVNAGLGQHVGGAAAPWHTAMVVQGLPFELTFAVVIVLFIAKNLLYAHILAQRSRLSQEWMHHIGDRLYRQYQDSSFHGGNRQLLARFGGTLPSTVIHAVNDFLVPMIDAIAEILVIISLTAILLWLSGAATMFVIVVPGALTWWGYRLLGACARTHAQDRLHSNGKIQRWVEDSGGCGREIALYQAGDAFAARCSQLVATLARAVSSHKNSHELIFPMCELAAIMGLALLVGLLWLGPGVTTVSLLTYLAVGGRLLPSFRRLAAALHNVAAHRADVEALVDTIRPPGGTTAPLVRSEQSRIVALRGVGYRHPGAAEFLFRAVDLDIAPGEWVAVTGASGCGKSTLLDLFVGRLAPAEGQITWHGAGRQGVGYAGPATTILDLNLNDNLGFPDAHAFPPQAITDALDIAQASHLDIAQADHPAIAAPPTLSSGERQRLGLARAVLHARTLLILDEATASLDETTEARFLDALRTRRPDLAVVIVTHRPSTATRADRTLRLGEGKLTPRSNDSRV